MKSTIRVLALACVLISAGAASAACPAQIKTNVSPVADIANAGGKIEQTGHQIFTSVVKAHDASPGLVSQQVEDGVALAVNKLGHVGLDLDAALGAYNAAKAAGGDLTAQRAAVVKILATVEQAMADVGKVLPPGTIQTVDALVTDVLTAVATVKLGVGL